MVQFPWRIEVLRLMGEKVSGRREAESGTSSIKELVLQLKHKVKTSCIYKMPRGFHGPRQDYVKFAVAQQATLFLSQNQQAGV